VDYFESLDPASRIDLIRATSLSSAISIARQIPEIDYRDAEIELRTSSALSAWRAAFTQNGGEQKYLAVPILRAAVSQATRDRMKSAESCIRPEFETHARSVKPVKAPELREHVYAAMTTLFSPEIRKLGGGVWRYVGTLNGQRISAVIDYGGRYTQLHYSIDVVGTKPAQRFERMSMESLLGVGPGDWDSIVEDNVADSMALLAQAFRYVSELPVRLPPEVYAPG
jgi:hypothetical protein